MIHTLGIGTIMIKLEQRKMLNHEENSIPILYRYANLRKRTSALDQEINSKIKIDIHKGFQG